MGLCGQTRYAKQKTERAKFCLRSAFLFSRLLSSFKVHDGVHNWMNNLCALERLHLQARVLQARSCIVWNIDDINGILELLVFVSMVLVQNDGNTFLKATCTRIAESVSLVILFSHLNIFSLALPLTQTIQTFFPVSPVNF